MRDILFREPDFIFSYRVGGVLIRENPDKVHHFISNQLNMP